MSSGLALWLWGRLETIFRDGGIPAMTLGLGILGCGEIAASHIRVFAAMEGVEIVALSSRDASRREEKANYLQSVLKEETEWTRRREAEAEAREERARLNGRIEELSRRAAGKPGLHQDWRGMLEDERVGAVVLCTPPMAHEEQAVAAAKAGRHIFCEGPMACTTAECDAMIESAARAGIVLTVQFGSRFEAAPHMAKRAIQTGALGRLLLVKADVLWFRDQAYYDRAPWRGRWDGAGGGAAMHHGRYMMDMMLWLMGPVRDVEARTATLAHEIEVEDSAVATLRFENGPLGQFFATTCAHPGASPFRRLEIFGERASLAVAPDWRVGAKDKEFADKLHRELASATLGPLGGTAGQARDWIEAIRDGREPFVTPGEARAQVELAERMYKASGAR